MAFRTLWGQEDLGSAQTIYLKAPELRVEGKTGQAVERRRRSVSVSKGLALLVSSSRPHGAQEKELLM